MGAEIEDKQKSVIALARGLGDKEDAFIEACNSLQALKAEVDEVKLKARRAVHNRRKRIQDALVSNGMDKSLAKWMAKGVDELPDVLPEDLHFFSCFAPLPAPPTPPPPLASLNRPPILAQEVGGK
eukprot:684093-Pyramimonas_sp.AAC.1